MRLIDVEAVEQVVDIRLQLNAMGDGPFDHQIEYPIAGNLFHRGRRDLVAGVRGCSTGSASWGKRYRAGVAGSDVWCGRARGAARDVVAAEAGADLGEQI